MKPNGVRVVVFGLPDSGKSSLLGAFLQAGKSQPTLLKGQIVDQTGLLNELNKKAYEEVATASTKKSRSGGASNLAPEEILELPFRFENDEDKTTQAGILVDSNGEAALDIMDGDDGFAARRPLTKAILEADTVMLVIDAGVPPQQLEETFQKFAEFLKDFQQQRGKRTDISGLPVYLVLNKCDLLAKKTDTNSMWMQRIEEGKRKIDQRFRAALANHEQDVPFGSIQLHLWATAIRRPPLADRPARTTEPYGVAELFRQIMESAEDFNEQRDHARFVLGNTIIGLGILVLFMAFAAALFFWNRPSPELSKLESDVISVLPNPKAPKSDLFREPLAVRLKTLEKAEESPLYYQLPSHLRGEIDRAKGELGEYSKLLPRSRDLTRTAIPDNEEEVVAYENELKTFLHDLGPRAETWDGSDLVAEVKQRQKDVLAFRKAVADELEWIEKQKVEVLNLREEGFKLRASSEAMDVILKKGKAWAKQSQETLDRPRRFVNRAMIEQGIDVRFDQVAEFQPVREAFDKYVEAKKELEDIRKEVFNRYPQLR